MEIYYRKSFFKGLDSFKTGKILFMLLQVFSLFFMMYNYTSGFVALNIFSLLYFVLHMLHEKKLITKHNAEITKYHKVRVKVYRILLIAFIMFALTVIFKAIICPIRFSILWWIGWVSIMLYSESITISSLVAFGENGYVSGDFFVNYNDIDEICEVKNMNSWQGEIVLITFWKNNQKIGFDKMFVDEYHKLRLQVYQGGEC